MRLVLPEPAGDRLEPMTIAPGVRLQTHRDEPLPADLAGWRARVIGGAEVLEVVAAETTAGWPVTLVRTGEPGLFAFYELYDRGVVVAVMARDPQALDQSIAPLRELLLAADVDRQPREVVALVQLWEGLA